jgi:hypothetical protein
MTVCSTVHWFSTDYHCMPTVTAIEGCIVMGVH